LKRPSVQSFVAPQFLKLRVKPNALDLDLYQKNRGQSEAAPPKASDFNAASAMYRRLTFDDYTAHINGADAEALEGPHIADPVS
jgi:hypothetical protein